MAALTTEEPRARLTIDHMDLLDIVKGRLGRIRESIITYPDQSLVELEERIGEVTDIIREYRTTERSHVG